MPKKMVIFWLTLAATLVFLIFDFLDKGEIQYDLPKASSVAESILAQHLHDTDKNRGEYGEPQIIIWKGDAIIIFRSLKDIDEEIIVSLGKDGSVTLSLGAPPKKLLEKILEH